MNTVTQMQHKPVQLSAAVIAAFFTGSDAQQTSAKVAQLEGSRMQYLLRAFEASDTSTIRAAVKEYKDDAKRQAADQKVPKVATTRGGEVLALYGGWRFGEVKPDAYSYHDAVKACRESLKSRGIKWDGTHETVKWERDAKAEVEAKAKAELAAKLEVGRRTRSGEELSEDQETAIYAKATAQVEREKMSRLAAAILKRYGAEQCGFLIDALEGAIAAATQEGHDKAAEQAA